MSSCPLFQEIPLSWQLVSCNHFPKRINWAAFCHTKMCGLWPFHVTILMLMSDLASCIKHIWFVNEACVLFPLRNKLCFIFFILCYFNSFKMKEATSLPLLPAASIFQLPLWDQARFNELPASTPVSPSPPLLHKERTVWQSICTQQ